MSDTHILEAIRKIVERGNSAEVKRAKDGRLIVYEIRKNIVAS